MEIVDKYLNKITMYRLVLYYLTALFLIAVFLSSLKLLPYSPLDIILSTVFSIATGWVSNFLLARFFRATTNVESVFITSFIISLIVPPNFPLYLLFVVGATFLAMLSKYVITVDRRHILNPAAAGIAIFVLLFPGVAANWWIGSKIMVIPVLIGGLLIVRKVRREKMVLSFFATYLVLTYLVALLNHNTPAALLDAWQKGFFSSPILFFSFVMLTEPLTSPTKFKNRVVYAVIVGFLYTTPLLKVTSYIFTPEIALLIGNIFSFFTISKARFEVIPNDAVALTPDTFLLSFKNNKKLNFSPGQYLEWTLPHFPSDSRGVRRYFSIASAPNENLMILVRFFKDSSSSFKRALFDFSKKRKIIATNLSGEFVLPKNTKRPLIFIAGGVGIAPFRSMLINLIEKGEKRDITLFFIAKNKRDIIFRDVFEKAKDLGLKTVYVLTEENVVPQNWKGHVGRLDFQTLQNETYDINSSLIYISGPQMMVESIQNMLKHEKIKGKNVKVDFFPGYS